MTNRFSSASSIAPIRVAAIRPSGSTMTVKGYPVVFTTPFGSRRSCRPCGSCRLGYTSSASFSKARASPTDTSALIPTTRSPSPRSSSCTRESPGASARHGPHHDAHALTTTTFPRSPFRLNRPPPSTRSPAISGIATRSAGAYDLSGAGPPASSTGRVDAEHPASTTSRTATAVEVRSVFTFADDATRSADRRMRRRETLGLPTGSPGGRHSLGPHQSAGAQSATAEREAGSKKRNQEAGSGKPEAGSGKRPRITRWSCPWIGRSSGPGDRVVVRVRRGDPSVVRPGL